MKKGAAIAFACLCLLSACQRPQFSETDAPANPPAKAAADTSTTTTQATKPAGHTAEYMLPGDFAPDTDVSALRKRFGDAHVRVGDVPGAEGEQSRGIVLFPDDSTRRAYLYFQDEESLHGLRLVRVYDADTRWRLDNGIAMGMPLSELVERNDRPIEYTGLGWDYGGTVSDLHGGALTPPANDAVVRGWRLGAADSEHGYARKAYPVGEATYSSDDSRYPDQGRNVIVRELSVSFPGEDDL